MESRETATVTTRFDRLTIVTYGVLGILLWTVFPVLGLPDDGLWRAVRGMIALVVGALAVVQMRRQRRKQDSAAELHLNTRDSG